MLSKAREGPCTDKANTVTL